MKKVLSIVIALVLCLSFCACGDSGLDNKSDMVSAENGQDTFKEGDVLSCPCGDSFKMRIAGTEDFATITTLKATKEKEADINNPDDYPIMAVFRGYHRYIYNVDVSGKVDKKYAGMVVDIDFDFEVNHTLIAEPELIRTIVNPDGTFQIGFRAFSNKNENVIIPHGISVHRLEGEM